MSTSTQHLSNPELLLACDGEAGSRAELHLSACPQCRARVDELRALDHASHQLRAEARRPLPPPPNPWKPLPATTTTLPIRRRNLPLLRFALAAAALVLVTLVLRSPREAAMPSFQELLASAERAQQP